MCTLFKTSGDHCHTRYMFAAHTPLVLVTFVHGPQVHTAQVLVLQFLVLI